tara:strand:+ start:2051 stop:2794 length:744 start_codon:yes stop_codon:yes gene_type:complete
MIVAIFGDTHGHLDEMYKRVAQWEARIEGPKIELVIQVGDFGIYLRENWGDFLKYYNGDAVATHPTVFCRGNHETQQWLMGKEGQEVATNILFLGDGKVYNINGLKIGVCGGNYSWKSYAIRRWTRERRYDTNLYTARPRKWYDHIMPYMVKELMDKEFDVFLTHEAPNHTGIIGRPQFRQQNDKGDYLPLGCPGFNKIIRDVRPKYQFHGHHHTFNKVRIDATTVYCLNKVDEHASSSQCMLVIDL